MAFSVSGFITHEDGYRSAEEVPVLAYLVLEEAPVWLLDPLREVAEEDKRRYDGILEHRYVFDLDEFAFV